MGRPPKSDDDFELRRAMGLRLERLRRWHGMLQQDVAKALNVTVGTVVRYESGRCAPRLETLSLLRRFFSVTLDHLVLGERVAEATDIGLLARLGRMDALPPEHKAGLFRLIDAYLDSHEVPHGAGALARSRSLE